MLCGYVIDNICCIFYHHIYIYVYMYVYIHIYIYISQEMWLFWREWAQMPESDVSKTAIFPMNILYISKEET